MQALMLSHTATREQLRVLPMPPRTPDGHASRVLMRGAMPTRQPTGTCSWSRREIPDDNEEYLAPAPNRGSAWNGRGSPAAHRGRARGEAALVENPDISVPEGTGKVLYECPHDSRRASRPPPPPSSGTTSSSRRPHGRRPKMPCSTVSAFANTEAVTSSLASRRRTVPTRSPVSSTQTRCTMGSSAKCATATKSVRSYPSTAN